MGQETDEKQAELNRQRDEYQILFELVPCIITVQDSNFKILRYNREFSDMFGSKRGDFCFEAYKGRAEKCEDCPLEKSFIDGKVHHGEHAGFNKDGTVVHWIVKTSPIRNSKGDIIAVMEMSVDITQQMQLRAELEKSERKYHAIFNNIPNPVFVLDANTLEILDCNESMKAVYGYAKKDVIKSSFLDLFPDEDQDLFDSKLKVAAVINKAKHKKQDGGIIFVTIRVSPSEYQDQKVLLVTTSDITKRLEAEQQLIQASKLATLGEMATGVAHELNQPLSVIKTASSFLARKTGNKQAIDDEILLTMLSKINSNIDRASKIIKHMRQFSRKSDMALERVQVNEVLKSAFEIFNQQLRARGIEVVWDIDKELPLIMAEPNRLEQVFINLLLNARDAIEEKWGEQESRAGDKKILLKTRSEGKKVVIEVSDTGPGISKAFSDKVFEPFFTTKDVGKGTGLGLSISYGIVKDCGGSIQIDKDREGGATFIIKFPIQDND